MADFIRKKRNLCYQDSECRRYIRKDFSKKCAYCGVREGDLSGETNFQIDHFIPQSKGGMDTYDNLFYSCISCNGKSGKSDYVSETQLNPCVDDIFNNGRIFCNDKFEYVYRDVRGKEFIDVMKLNRVGYIRRRKNINKYRMDAKKKLEKLSLLPTSIANKDFIEIIKETIEESKKIIENGNSYLEATNEDDGIEKLLEFELSKFCNYKKLNENYNIDYIIEKDNKKLFLHNVNVDMNFKNELVIRQVKNEDIEKWANMEFDIKLIYFDKSTRIFYFADVNSVIKSNSRTDVYIYKQNKLGIQIFG